MIRLALIYTFFHSQYRSFRSHHKLHSADSDVELSECPRPACRFYVDIAEMRVSLTTAFTKGIQTALLSQAKICLPIFEIVSQHSFLFEGLGPQISAVLCFQVQSTGVAAMSTMSALIYLGESTLSIPKANIALTIRIHSKAEPGTLGEVPATITHCHHVRQT
jgi:hypothetical protein